MGQRDLEGGRHQGVNFAGDSFQPPKGPLVLAAAKRKVTPTPSSPQGTISQAELTG